MNKEVFLKNHKQLLWFALFTAVAFGISRFFVKDERILLKKELENNEAEFVKGHVTASYYGGRGTGNAIDYTYEFGDKQFEGRDHYPKIYSASIRRFKGRYFPVLVSHHDEDLCTILISPEDFKFFDRDFPDSLEWVEQWIEPED